jgi:hypothetical protein
MKLIKRETSVAHEYSTRHTAAVGGGVKARVWVVLCCSRRSLSPEQHVRDNVHNCELLSSFAATNCAENPKVRQNLNVVLL